MLWDILGLASSAGFSGTVSSEASMVCHWLVVPWIPVAVEEETGADAGAVEEAAGCICWLQRHWRRTSRRLTPQAWISRGLAEIFKRFLDVVLAF